MRIMTADEVANSPGMQRQITQQRRRAGRTDVRESTDRFMAAKLTLPEVLALVAEQWLKGRDEAWFEMSKKAGASFGG